MKTNIFQIFAVVFHMGSVVHSGVVVNNPIKMDLIETTGTILCNSHLKTIYVYFENETSLSYPGLILKRLANCNISYISIRNKFKTSPLEVIKDDGILMYLIMMLRDASQNIELSIIKKKSAAKHLSHVVVLIEDSKSVTTKWMHNAFEKFWRVWLLNVVIIFWRHQQLQIYRYNPFSEDFLIKLDYRPPLPVLSELFPKTLPNMQKKPLRMCMYADEIRAIFRKDGSITGSDGFMANYIARRLNATRIIDQVSVYGSSNRSADICFREVAQELDDISMNIRFLSAPTFRKRVENTIVHSRDDLCVMVPKAKIASTFWNLFRSFELFVWLMILISVPLAYGFCICVYRRMCLEERVLLQLLAATLSMPLTRVPHKYSLRLFLFCWMFYGMLICGAFKGNLTSNVVFRMYHPDIDTIKDLALSPYKLLTFGRHSKHLERFLNSSNRYEARVQRKSQVVPDQVLLGYIAENNVSYAYLEKYHVATFHVNARQHTRYGRNIYHLMSTCLVPFHAVFIVPYGSPYLGFINSLVRSSQEFGFALFWERLMNAAFIKSGKRVIRSQKNGDDPVVLKLSHLKAAFTLLTLGLGVAAFVFLWEILWTRKLSEAWSKIVKRIKTKER